MINKIGFVECIKFDELKAHLIENAYKLVDMYSDELDSIRKAHMFRGKNYNWECEFGNSFDSLMVDYLRKSGKFGDEIDSKLAFIKSSIEHYAEVGGQLEIVAESERFWVIKYATKSFIAVPKMFVVVKYAKDLSGLTLAEINLKLTGKTFASSSVDSLSVSKSNPLQSLTPSDTLCGIRNNLTLTQQELAQKEMELKEQYELKREEMERVLREFKAKQEEQLAVLNEQVEKLKDQVFLIELDIFALRSLFGDTFTMTQLKSGKISDAPLVLYQKFRFLDEEFALLAARQFGKFNGQHGTTTEIFKNPIVQERFLPSEKCITFFRTSKDQKYWSYDPKLDGLEALKYYHGSQVGMLIRNGDNVWLSFIDEEVFVEDNLFDSELTAFQQHERIKPKFDGEYDYQYDVIIKGKTKLRDSVVRKVVNKSLLFYVLEGLIKSTDIFKDLKDVDIRIPSDHVIFSAADNQIGVSKYPDFKTYFTNWYDNQSDLRVGDPIMVVERSAASKWNGDSRSGYETHRSRGYQNRARDAEDIKAGMHQISFIDSYKRYYKLLVDEPPYKTAEENGGKVVYYRSETTASHKDDSNVTTETHYEFYVSVKRPYAVSWNSRRINRVNLRVYEYEFCPMVYINSNYVLAWMEQKNIGDWYKGNYVYLVENCFHKALQFLQDREKHEMTLLLPLIPEWSNTPDELDLLLEWKKSNHVKNLTEWQAKRFVNWYKEARG